MSDWHCCLPGHAWSSKRTGRYFECMRCPARRLVPVQRVPAWRVPNEDGAAVGVRYARLVAQYPVHPWNLGAIWDTCTAPSDDGSRRVMLERERMAKVDADLRAEGFGRVDPGRRPWLGWCLK